MPYHRHRVQASRLFIPKALFPIIDRYLVWAYERQKLRLYPIADVFQEQMEIFIRRETRVLASQNIHRCFPPGKQLNFPDYTTLPGSLVEVEFYVMAHTNGGGLKWEVKCITVLE